MSAAPLRIGTRDSQLAVWQATEVQRLLHPLPTELVYIKSEGDLDTVTPLYELGVQGIFTKALDAALLSGRIDLAVHSMKDVPTAMAAGLQGAAVLPRASHKDILVYTGDPGFLDDRDSEGFIATSSVRRIAQWKRRYPHHRIDNLRGNVNTRLRKLAESPWNGAVFAAAGLERIGLRPETSVDLDWMLPAPAQGAILVVCRTGDHRVLDACAPFNDPTTALCARIERDFLRILQGGCSTPISALAQTEGTSVRLRGNILSPDGSEAVEVDETAAIGDAGNLGRLAAEQILNQGGAPLLQRIRTEGLIA